uniref:Uncharacterized protein n=1 Tax=Salvator merianae TaxID=96440 RepID=A0A8D0DRE2_SALMN
WYGIMEAPPPQFTLQQHPMANGTGIPLTTLFITPLAVMNIGLQIQNSPFSVVLSTVGALELPSGIAAFTAVA